MVEPRCATRVAGIAWGMVLEPLFHPKPGAVTRLSRHHDKGVIEFEAGALAGFMACNAACQGGCRGFMARAIRAYIEGLHSLGLRGNIQLGTVLLASPLCHAAPRAPRLPLLFRYAKASVESCTGREDAAAYYEALESLSPSHLGRLEGEFPGVGSGRVPDSFMEILWFARWDHVHRELLEGYPLTEKAYRIIQASGGPLREEAVAAAILELLAEHGDTLIAAKWGWSSYKRALLEAREARSRFEDPPRALEWLDERWRPRGWNPGSVLDIIAVAVGLAVSVRLGLLVEG